MPISSRDFNKRHVPPVRAARKGSVRRSTTYVAATEAGAAMTAAGVVAAAGAALTAVGIAEYSVSAHHGSPFDWVVLDVGLGLMGLGIALALFFFVLLVWRRVGVERWRTHLAVLARNGQLFLDQMIESSKIPDPKDTMTWYLEAAEDLTNHDPTGAMTTLFESDAGLPTTPSRLAEDLKNHAITEKWITVHTGRLNAFLEESLD